MGGVGILIYSMVCLGIALGITVAFGCVVRKIMLDKGYTNVWFWCGFFLGVIGIIIALVMPDKGECKKNWNWGRDPKGEAEAINEYKNLYDNGIITYEEFEAKKKQLLGL